MWRRHGRVSLGVRRSRLLGPLSIQVSLYEAVRDQPRWFVVVPGHEREGVERVVQEHHGCLVIEKLGEAGEVAEDTDPRP
jgi:hypothetical protein